MSLQKKTRLIAVAIAIYCGAALADAPPWMNQQLSADQRAALVVQQMTMDEKLKLVFGYFGTDFDSKKFKRPPESYTQSAGFVYGVPRLGIPHLWETDAGVGVASQAGPDVRQATALPSGLNTAATWDAKTAYEGGAMIGAEARGFGFNVLLAGGVNLLREPRNGRNFEYGGEDPLLAGKMVGAQIRGIQSNHIVSTLKHYAFNDQESGRNTLNVKIDDQAARTSDLLALQLAMEEGDPGSVMCAYNRVNGVYSCESNYLLNEVLKGDWGFKGWVMSDWGATHSTIPAANAGLDQQSGIPFDHSDYFGPPLKEAVLNGWVPPARLDDMVRRIVRTMFAHGLVDKPVTPAPIDFKAHGAVALKDAQEGMVLLKNANRTLPLNAAIKRIAVIGGHADKGVLAGGGSSLVYPIGGNAAPELEPKVWPGPIMVYPSSPLKAIAARAPKAQVTYRDGVDVAAAARLAKDSDVVVLFATQWTGEGMDVPNLSLPGKQDELIAAVTAANPRTVVVLETGGPVTMPWLPHTAAVLEAWYPGTSGGEAIASVLFGEVNPSGHLPATFPASEAQLPRAKVDGFPHVDGQRFDVTYHEGAAVGYKWFDLKGHKPLFPFGHGLSYTEFTLSGLAAEAKDGVLHAMFTVDNRGAVAGKEVAQVYVAPVDVKWEAPKRLVGFQKVALQAGERVKTFITVDPRLLGVYDSATKTWVVAKGDYKVILAASAMDDKATSVVVHLEGGRYDVNGKPFRFGGPVTLGPDDVRAFPVPPAGFADARSGIKQGKLEEFAYDSPVTGTRRKALVYLPADYSAQRRYPVLYLLHGIAGNEHEWTGYVHANTILDRLIADGKAAPMIVVMPNGRALADDRPPAGERTFTPEHIAGFTRFGEELLGTLIPAIDRHYATLATPKQRAIAGLSMGGGQSLNFGLAHPELFGAVGGFSAAPNTRPASELVGGAAQPQLLYLSCGNKDGLIAGSQAFHRYLKLQGRAHVWNVDEFGHDRESWMENLYDFAQLLFR